MEAIRLVAKRRLPLSARHRLRGAAQRIEQWAIRTARCFVSATPPVNTGGRVLLNLGCGHVTHPAFTNVDALAAWHIHNIRPVNDLRPFANDAVDLVYVSHCLEHFSHREVPAVIAEWRRVLKPGGVLRLGVPDFDALLDVYETSGRNVESIQEYLLGGQDYPLNFHHVAFTFDSLAAKLRAAGFREVRRWQRGADELTSLPDCTGATATIAGRTIPISLNVEAVK
jgi:predicted SAM-dependent methyltransferase